ncbi:MAG: hypothetical protein ACYC7J_03575 [Syntrophales bacterium]
MKPIMVRGMINLLTAVLLLTAAPQIAQERVSAAARPDPRQVFADLLRPYRGLNDYTVKIKAKVEMPTVRIPDFAATLSFKKPDKFHVETRHFAPIPRNSGVFNPFQFAPEKNRLEFLRSENLAGTPAEVYRAEPRDPKSPIRLYHLWVGGAPKRILQVESLSFRDTRATVKIAYQSVEQKDGTWLLPAQVHVHLTFPEGVQTPEGLTSPDNPVTGGMRRLDEISGEGDITIVYEDWRVNTGLDDSLFSP